jgi:REP element-mobilizing transposase RayT
MPRTSRQKSEAGIYHVMLRGIDRSQLFYDSEDRGAFLERLVRYKKECCFLLFAYCLMGNHVHLLIKEEELDLSGVIKRLANSYASYFNNKYERSGYVFEGRFKSEAISSEEQLLATLRYILKNPLKVGLSLDSWTSY